MKILAAIPFMTFAPAFWAGQPPMKATNVPDWTPPQTTVAKELVEAGQFLLKHGFADPRGGVFGLATIQTSEVGFYKPVKRDYLGWSVGDGKASRFVTLKGTAYPATVSFKPMDLGQQVSKACQMADNGTVFDGSRPTRFGDSAIGRKSIQIPPEQWLLSDQAVVLLLVVGDVKQAEWLYARRKHRAYSSMEPTLEPGLDKLFKARLVAGFMEDLWNQAVEAHIYGDDDLAAQACKNIIVGRKQYEAWIGKAVSLSYLDQAEVLLNDSLRRIKEKPSTIDFDQLKKQDQKTRIAKLIELLDGSGRFVNADPNYRDVPQMAVIAAINKEGEVAGDALLDCIEKDRRLTRRVFNILPERPVYRFETVRDQALEILDLMSRVEEFRYGGFQQAPFDVIPPISELRAKWSALKGLSDNQRLLWVLKNDTSQPEQWIKAAKALTTEDGSNRKRSLNLSLMTNQEQDDFGRVVERRIWSLELPVNPWTQEKAKIHSQSAALATSLMKADKLMGGPVLREVMSRAWDDTLRHDLKPDYRYQAAFVEAFNALVADGDKIAQDRYLEWLKLLPISSILIDRVDPFAGFSQMPTGDADAVIEALIKSPKFEEAAFLGKKTPMSFIDLLRTSIVEYPSFRRYLSGFLTDKTVVGKFVPGDEGHVAAQALDTTFGRWMMGSQLETAEKDSTCRSCDIIAATIYLPGLRLFDIAWSDARKDMAISKLVDMLSGKDAEALKQFLERCRSIRWR